MNAFNLKDICRGLVNDLQYSIDEKNRIKLSIDIQLPEILAGDPTEFKSTIVGFSDWMGRTLINGVITIDVMKRSQINREVIVSVNLRGMGKHSLSLDDVARESEWASAKLRTEVRTKLEPDEVTCEVIFPFALMEEQMAQPPAFRNKCILMAEDSEINALVFSGFMEEWGCEITVVQNGQEAIDFTKRNSYDLILMDVHMPVKNGIEAIREIRTFNSHTPIIALTASTLELDIKESLDHGASDYLLKPVGSRTLFRLLKKYLLAGNDINTHP